MEAALRRAAATHEIRTIIDVGASNGSWSVLARRFWPRAKVLLIEAQEAHRAALDASGFDYVLAAAGDKPGTIHFSADELFAGVASYDPTGSDDIVVPMTTIDAEIATRKLEPPFLIKLDTHGFERQILAGSVAALADAALLVIEAYNVELMPGAFRFDELCRYLDDRGFRPIDIVDPMHRPKDELLWQFDLVFGRSSDPRLADSAYG